MIQNHPELTSCQLSADPTPRRSYNYAESSWSMGIVLIETTVNLHMDFTNYERITKKIVSIRPNNVLSFLEKDIAIMEIDVTFSTKENILYQNIKKEK